MSIETDRLLIRSYHSQDLNDAYAFLSDQQVMHYLPEKVFDKEQVTVFIEKARESNDYLAVVLKDTQTLIGHIYFSPFFGDHSYEIGWVFNQSFHGKGYAYEAAKAVLGWGFTKKKIHRVIGTCQPENTGSYQLMEKLGMRREGYFKQCIPVDDGWWDEYYYAILASEWQTI